MTAPDAPPVEPLTLTLEEALQHLYAKGLTLIPPGDGTDSWGIGVASDSPDEEFDTWHEAVSAVEGVPVVPRDDTAELARENAELRRILGECTKAAGGAASPDCSLEFFAKVPREIELARSKDTAALVAAVESGLHYIKWAEEHGHMGAPSSRTLIEAALARVKGGER